MIETNKPLDIKETIEEIGRLEKLQAQLELRATQIREDEQKLREKLKSVGVSPTDLDKKILELEASISARLTTIRNLNNPIGDNGGKAKDNN